MQTKRFSSEKTLLVIEDEEELLDCFEEYGNTVYSRVLTAKDCKSARAILTENSVSCIVSDNFLTDGNGFSLMKELNLTKGEIPIILITGFADKKLAVECVNNNLFYFLEKPFKKEKFITVLQNSYNLLKKNDQLNKTINLYNLNESTKSTLIKEYKLSKREVEIIGSAIHLCNNNEIAKKLFISTQTVKKHLYNIFTKMKISSKNQLRQIIFEMNTSLQ